MSTTRNNNTCHVEVHVDGAFHTVEAFRDTLGGWANMTRRVAAALGANRLTPLDENGGSWDAAGSTVTFTHVQRL